jgi:hypothetical protein
VIQALWSVEFVNNQFYFGGGVVVLASGKALGGDSNYYYKGEYELRTDGVFNARVEVTHYFGALSTIFGPVEKLTLVLGGNVERDHFLAEGHVEGNPEARITIRFTRRAELR